MKIVLAILLASIASLPAGISAEECTTPLPRLVELLDQYSTANGTKFVVDPRVHAKATLVGIVTEDLDASTLIGILNIHGFTAFTSNGIVYVVPETVAENGGDRFGNIWEG